MGVSKCLEFGAVMERDSFESVVARVYGGTLEEAMASALLLDQPTNVCNIASGGARGSCFTTPASFVGYAQSRCA